jgi:two-component system, response regulator PdtaR
MRVMIVEDEALIAMHLEMLVREFGHVISATAASAAEAIAHAASYSPDVVLMDIRLKGGSSGIDAARELYTRQALRCIFLSANLDETTKAVLSAYEPIEFLGKPVLPIMLQQALKKAEGLSKL